MTLATKAAAAAKKKAVVGLMKERDLQRFVFDAIRMFCERGVFAFHPFNEGRRAVRSKDFYRRLGMLAGLADVVIVFPHGRVKFMELKTETGVEGLDQIAFARQCADSDCDYWLVRTPEEATATLFAWGALTENPLSHRQAGKAA